LHPDHPSNTLKRNRPKTNWMGYVGIVSTSLVLGLTVAYVIQQTNNNTKSVTTTHLSKVKHSTAQPAPITVVSVKPETANPQLKTQTRSKTQKIPTSSTNTPLIQQQIVEAKTTSNKKTNQTTGAKNHSKPSQNIPDKVHPSKKLPDHHTPVPVTPSKTDDNRPINLLDRITDTVRFLLTGEKNN
jgi:hypothetical protein